MATSVWHRAVGAMAVAATASLSGISSGLAQTTTVYNYDALGRLIRTTDSSGLTAAYQYDRAGNRVQVSNGSDGTELFPTSFTASSLASGSPGSIGKTAMRDIEFSVAPSVVVTNSESQASLTADLGTSQFIHHVLVAPANAPDRGIDVSNLNGSQVEVSADGTNWTTSGAVSSAISGAYFSVTVNTTARYVRVRRLSAGQLGVGDLRVYASAAASAPQEGFSIPAITKQTTVNTAIQFNPVAGYSDPAHTSLSIRSVAKPAHGNTSLSGNLITYTPDSNFNGPDPFTYTVQDALGATATGSVNMTVNASSGHFAVAVDDYITANLPGPVIMNLAANDYDPDGDTVRVLAVGSPSHGTISFIGGLPAYTPASGWAGGVDTFEYYVTDDHQGMTLTPGHVTITMLPGNNAPTAGADSIVATRGVAYTFDPRLNDSDPDSDPLTVDLIVTNPSHGTATLNPDSTITYTPTSTYVGTDTFTYRLRDDHSHTVNGTVNAQVYASNEFLGLTPAAVQTWWDGNTGKAYTTAAVSNYQGFPSLLLTKSPTYPSGSPNYTGTVTEPGQVSVAGASSSGADWDLAGGERLGVAFEARGLGTSTNLGLRIHYWDVNWADLGDSTETTTTINGWQHAEAIVTAPAAARHARLVVNVTDAGDTRTASLHGAALRKPQFYRLATGQSLPAWTGTGQPNSPPVAVADTVNTNAGSPIVISALTNDTDPDSDVLTITGFGTAAHGTPSITGGGTTLTYTPTSGYAGVDSFTYTISDGRGGSATGTINITPGNTQPNATNDSVTTERNVPVTFDPRTNDSDPDGDPLTITGTPTGMSHGTAVNNSGTSITYTPATGYYGADSFSYTISDGRGGTRTATVSVNVMAANEFAGFEPDATTTWWDGNMHHPYTATLNTNYQGYRSLFFQTSPPDAPNYTGTTTETGQLALFGAAPGGAAWEVTSGEKVGVAFEALKQGATTNAKISLYFYDASWAGIGEYGATNYAVTSWTHIEATAIAPTNAKYVVAVVALTSSGDQRTAPLHGAILRKPQFYRLATGQSIPAYTGTAQTNGSPSAQTDTVATVKNTAKTFDPRANDTDPDGDTLTITGIVSQGAHGTATYTGSSITYTPTSNYVGTDVLTYSISDGHGGTAQATVNVTINPSNEFTWFGTAVADEWWDGNTGKPFTVAFDSNYLGTGILTMTAQKGPTYPSGPPNYNGTYTIAGQLAFGGAGASPGAPWDVTAGERIGAAIEASALGATTHVQVYFHYWDASWADVVDSAVITTTLSGWTRSEVVATAPTNAAHAVLVVMPMAAGNQQAASLHGIAIRKPQFSRVPTGMSMPPY